MENKNENTCCVCLQPPQQPYLLHCEHGICLKCLVQIMRSKSGSHLCPICRRKIDQRPILNRPLMEMLESTKESQIVKECADLSEWWQNNSHHSNHSQHSNQNDIHYLAHCEAAEAEVAANWHDRDWGYRWLPTSDDPLYISNSFINLAGGWRLKTFGKIPCITVEQTVIVGRRAQILTSNNEPFSRVEAAARCDIPSTGYFRSSIELNETNFSITVYDSMRLLPAVTSPTKMRISVASRGVFELYGVFGVRWHVVSACIC